MVELFALGLFVTLTAYEIAKTGKSTKTKKLQSGYEKAVKK